MEILLWLQDWYIAKCDGEWEFREGIKLLSTSNPGWSVEINVSDTSLEDVYIPPKYIKNTSEDWYGFVLEDALFTGSGDPSKLVFILEAFKALTEGKDLP